MVGPSIYLGELCDLMGEKEKVHAFKMKEDWQKEYLLVLKLSYNWFEHDQML